MDIYPIPRSSYKRIGIGALNEIPDPPKELWMRGTLPPQATKKLAVVGSRALTPYGTYACETLIKGLAGHSISIVSGLALGVDACAHRAALAHGLHTIAVPGSGLGDSSIAPQTNLALAKEIVTNGGALLSEHPPETTARPQYFPSRNRIMVGMSDAVLVIEAGEKSGTLITARLAVDYNRDLLCVPHRIDDAHGFGSQLFLRLGATLVSNSSHILEVLGLSEPKKELPLQLPLMSDHEILLYTILETPTARDRLIHQSKLSPSDVSMALVTLELKGVAKEQYGAWRRT